jgi:hypothetical protein
MTLCYASLPSLLRRLYSLLPIGHTSKPQRVVRWKPEKKTPGPSPESPPPHS